MKSNDVSGHRVFDPSAGQTKKPWVTPSIEIIALQSAASGGHATATDGGGAYPYKTHAIS